MITDLKKHMAFSKCRPVATPELTKLLWLGNDDKSNRSRLWRPQAGSTRLVYSPTAAGVQCSSASASKAAPQKPLS
ncbi:hypothetical protein T11_8927 [Trichinella zimbabwensis]|uniref:Uncharacterized protein n=1 Tax=Trichinella zimbabwensis TaxID=268475 RepID=A0A0V1I2M7_9BILA|nr:hypothetical protein T11_8927 [Trichinella zimbabwensis]